MQGKLYDEFPVVAARPMPPRQERQKIRVALEERFQKPHEYVQIA